MTDFVVLKIEFKFVSITSDQSFSSSRSNKLSRVIPALLINTSIWPKSVLTRLIKSDTALKSLISTPTPKHFTE